MFRQKKSQGSSQSVKPSHQKLATIHYEDYVPQEGEVLDVVEGAKLGRLVITFPDSRNVPRRLSTSESQQLKYLLVGEQDLKQASEHWEDLLPVNEQQKEVIEKTLGVFRGRLEILVQNALSTQAMPQVHTEFSVVINYKIERPLINRGYSLNETLVYVLHVLKEAGYLVDVLALGAQILKQYQALFDATKEMAFCLVNEMREFIKDKLIEHQQEHDLPKEFTANDSLLVFFAKLDQLIDAISIYLELLRTQVLKELQENYTEEQAQLSYQEYQRERKHYIAQGRRVEAELSKEDIKRSDFKKFEVSWLDNQEIASKLLDFHEYLSFYRIMGDDDIPSADMVIAEQCMYVNQQEEKLYHERTDERDALLGDRHVNDESAEKVEEESRCCCRIS